ncbi:MAG: hypothetical protein AAF502_14585 [Bacteroidota bacterium]
MKAKTTQYILGLALIVIWGIIGQKVFAALKNDDQYSVIAQNDIPVTSITEQDSFTLFLNYDDPFRLTTKKNSSKVQKPIGKHKPVKRTIPKKAPSVKVPNFAFKGMIKNHRTGKQAGLISVDGKYLQLDKGEILEGIKLLTITRDSALISWNGTPKTIFRNR